MRRERIEDAVAHIVDSIAMCLLTRDELHAVVALVIREAVPDRTDRLRIYEFAERDTPIRAER